MCIAITKTNQNQISFSYSTLTTSAPEQQKNGHQRRAQRLKIAE